MCVCARLFTYVCVRRLCTCVRRCLCLCRRRSLTLSAHRLTGAYGQALTPSFTHTHAHTHTQTFQNSGGEMFDYLVAHGRMGDADARKWFQQMLSAIHYCHARGYVHRDLKVCSLPLDLPFFILTRVSPLISPSFTLLPSFSLCLCSFQIWLYFQAWMRASGFSRCCPRYTTATRGDACTET